MVINRLSITSKSDFFDKIKRNFFHTVNVSTTVWLHNVDSNKKDGENLDENYTKMLHAVLKKNLGSSTPQIVAVQTLTSNLTNKSC